MTESTSELADKLKLFYDEIDSHVVCPVCGWWRVRVSGPEDYTPQTAQMVVGHYRMHEERNREGELYDAESD